MGAGVSDIQLIFGSNLPVPREPVPEPVPVPGFWLLRTSRCRRNRFRNRFRFPVFGSYEPPGAAEPVPDTVFRTSRKFCWEPVPPEPVPGTGSRDPVPPDPVPRDPAEPEPVPRDPVPPDPVPGTGSRDPVPPDPVPADPVPVGSGSHGSGSRRIRFPRIRFPGLKG